MKIKSFASVIIQFVLLAGCSAGSGNGTGDLPYHIKWSDFMNTSIKLTKLSSIASSISYIRLKTPDTIKLGIIRKISMTKENLFILDQTSSIYVFDLEGNLQNKINHVGRGPGEYQFLLNFTVDEKNKLIALLSNRRAMFYDFQGKFVKEIEIEGVELPQVIEWIGDANYGILMHIAVLNEDDPDATSTAVINLDGKVIKKHRYFVFEKRPESARMSFVGSLSKVAGGILVKEPYNDTTFIINNNAARTPYIINDFGDYRAPREFLEIPNIDPVGISKYIISYRTLLFPEYAFVSFVNNRQPYSGIWDFRKDAAFSIPATGLEDDIDFGLPFITPRESRDNLIDIIEPVKLLADKGLSLRQGSQLSELVKGMKIDDNPILRILKTKTNIKAEK